MPYTQLPPFHAQWGEDSWLATHRRIPAHGVFVNVGAGDGIRGSNSLYFENLGWSGLAIDADPRNADALAARQCSTSTYAIATEPGPRRFGMYTRKPSWSGLARCGPEYTPITVDCVRLEMLLTGLNIGPIDLLSIDVEGTELDVWDSFDHTRHPARMIIIEYDDRHPQRTRTRIHHHLGVDQYRVVHETAANLILEHQGNPW